MTPPAGDPPRLPAAFDLTGRVALVTGSGGPTGIGFASARMLAQLGAAVLLTSLSPRCAERAEELRAAGADAHAVPADLTVPADADLLVGTALERWGRVDVVVNNAGMVSVADPDGWSESGSFTELDVDVWRASLARNLDSAYLVSRAALPPMVDAGFGRVVMVASVTGPVMAMRAEPAYAAAKAGMVGLARALAVDTAAHGVTVNAVAPGWIATGSQTEHEREQGLVTPVGRSATPDEVAAAVAWLATPGAAYVTGQCLVVDGGNSVAEERS
ncbi:MAG: SDR family NAD(P)-dependent oxidoreductase [Candidatus Nanopelagicales bacterium]